MATSNNIVVLGAGVIGLTTAMRLSENAKNKVTIVAKYANRIIKRANTFRDTV